MNRIDLKFIALRAVRQKGFIVYISAGDPSLKATATLAREFERIGVDVLELGVPFSDPLADGVVNQLAAERALNSGTTLTRVLATVAGLRRSGCEIPVVFYIYFNLIHRYGVEKFAKAAAKAGVDGVLALDLPPEEAGCYEAALRAAGVHPIYIIAPTTPEARVAEICRHAGGFQKRRRDFAKHRRLCEPKSWRGSNATTDRAPGFGVSNLRAVGGRSD